jgi:putative membrane protein
MRRLSPLSVPYRVAERGGQLLFALVAVVVSSSGALADRPWLPLALVGGGVALGVALVAYELARYRRFAYALTADTLDIGSGVFARREREIPLSRIQNVDISRNVIQRALGVAAVRFETAGGSETEAVLRFVAADEATRLQREVARLKRGVETSSDRETAFELATDELWLLGALSFDFRLPGVALLLLSGATSLVPRLVGDASVAALVALVAVAVVGVALVSWVAGAAVAVLNYYGFVLSRADEGLEYERGLLQRYSGTIPLDKLQALVVRDNPLKRRFGYASLSLRTAGYAPGSGPQGGSEAAVPLATRERVDDLVADLEGVDLSAATFERPPKRVRRRYAVRYLLLVGALAALGWGVGAVVGGTVPWYLPLFGLPLVPPAAHLKWKHRGYWLGDHHAVTRNGVLRRSTTVVPYYRVQTVIDRRGPLQRRWRLATVVFDTAGSGSGGDPDAAAVDVDRETADRLRAAAADRLRDALARRRQCSKR